MAKNYENLEAWKEGIEIAIIIYRLTKNFPKDELYGLTSQIRRSAVSISNNIAEGAGRSSREEFKRFLNISLGSLNETESLLFLSLKLDYLDKDNFELLREKIRNVGNLIGGLRKYLINK